MTCRALAASSSRTLCRAQCRTVSLSRHRRPVDFFKGGHDDIILMVIWSFKSNFFVTFLLVAKRAVA